LSDLGLGSTAFAGRFCPRCYGGAGGGAVGGGMGGIARAIPDLRSSGG